MPRANAIELEQRDWLSAIQNGEMPQVTAEQGKQAVEIAQQVIDSIATHQWATAADSTGPFGAMSSIEASATTLPFMQPTDSNRTKKAA